MKLNFNSLKYEILCIIYFFYEKVYFLLKTLKIKNVNLFIVPLHLLKYSTFYSSEKDIKIFLKLVRSYKTNFELIRIGGDSDGGYLLPNDLDGIKYCFSPGVDYTSTFENHLTQYGIKCFLADYSVDSAPVDNKLFEFDKKFLGVKNNFMFFTLKDWIKSKNINDDNLLLQMDIEGYEYYIFKNIEKNLLLKFRIIVIEFHVLDCIQYSYGLDYIRYVFKNILNHFTIVHIHPNSFGGKINYKNFEIPKTMEFTFLRNDRIKNKELNKNFPHPLDKSNVKGEEDYILPNCWFE